MIRIRALNEESSDESEEDGEYVVPKRPTKEILEEEALAQYQHAMQLFADSQPAQSAEAFEEILRSPYLNIQGEDPKNISSIQSQLRMGCLKVLSKIYSSVVINYEAAAVVLYEATKSERDNVTLWFRLGTVEMKMLNYESAFIAFRSGHHCSPGHWGCLENLVTLAYVLHDNTVCLNYCAVGLKKDRGFIRGLVLRDHIYELNPHMKEIAKTKILNYDSLNVDFKYEESWKTRYLNEVRELMLLEIEKNNRILEKELQERNKVIPCPVSFTVFTYAELCSVVAKFHGLLKSYGTFLRPIQLSGETPNLPESKRIACRKNSVTDEEIDVTEEISRASSIRRSSSDDKDSAGLNAENKIEVMTGGTTENTSDTTFDDIRKQKTAGQDNEGQDKEDSDVPKRKTSKKGVKWWQMEGKRRSQRVKGQILPSPHKSSSKENKFVDTLRGIIPASLLCEVTTDMDLVKTYTSPEKSKTTINSGVDSYFGTGKEVSDVKRFIATYGNTDITTVVTRLVEILSEKTEMEWPSELAKEYISLFRIYRSHVPIPNLFFDADDDMEELEYLRIDSVIALTVLELLLDNTANSALEKLRYDERFLPELFKIKQATKTLNDRVLRLRLNWLLARYYLLLSNLKGISFTFESALDYLNQVEKDLQPDCVSIKICTHWDNSICIEEVKKKLNFVNRMENVNRIYELYNAKEFESLIEILTFSLTPEDTTSTDFTNRMYLAESYFHVEKYMDCLEQCLKIISSATGGKMRDNRILIKTTSLLENICVIKYKSEGYTLPLYLRKSIVQAMFKLLIFIEKEAKNTSYGTSGTGSSVAMATPWCVLHNILYQLEFQETAMYVDDDTVPSSILLLQFAHECVSASSNGCLLEGGKLLLYAVEELVHLKSIQGIHLEYEETKQCIEQSIFCLYGHPSRKSKTRHLNDHNTGSGIPLDWDKCLHLFNYYKPDDLPEVDSYNSISTDVEGLFQRILAVMPADVRPTQAFQYIKDYLDGKIEEKGFVEQKVDFPSQYADIFYLIGDHHFKAKEWTKAVEHYTWDLAVTFTRFDSWAAIALAKGESINHGLNACDNFTMDEIFSNANTVVNCFRQALNVQPGNTKIKIEFGSFVYAMHSFCSRLLKQSTDSLSMDQFDLIESKKEEFLATAAKSFESMAGRTSHSDELLISASHEEERWIHHYMLGKVFEKLDPNDVDKFLAQYELAGVRLHQQGACYPSKISFYNPPELAIEALEIYYRIHSSVLNYIEKHEYSERMDQILTKYLRTQATGPFVTMKTTRGETSDSRKKKELQDTADIATAMESILESVENKLKEDELLEKIESTDESPESTGGSSPDDTSSESSLEAEFPAVVLSYGLSAFKEKMRPNQKDVRVNKETSSVAEKLAPKEASTNKDQQTPHEAQKKTSEVVSVFVEMNSHFKDHTYGHLISQCVSALEDCISRFPAHHKSFYRLSYTFSVFANPKVSNKICKEWLLGCGPLDKKKICGLFSDRKSNNFFNCVWRNPVDDIDRPGSFPYHMSKTISHLLSVLERSNDHEMLAEIAIQLSKVPDTDKQYLYNFEREQYSQQAFKSCVAAAKRFVNENKNRIQEAAMSIFSSYVKLQKFNPKDNVMAGVLLETFKLHLDSQPEGVCPPSLTIEHAFKFYQHLAWTSKIQNSNKPNSTSGKISTNLTGTSNEAKQKNGSSANNTEVLDLASSSKARSANRVSWSQSQQRTSIVTQTESKYTSANMFPSNIATSTSQSQKSPFVRSPETHNKKKNKRRGSKTPILEVCVPTDFSKTTACTTALEPNATEDTETMPEELIGTLLSVDAEQATSITDFVVHSPCPWIEFAKEEDPVYTFNPKSYGDFGDGDSTVSVQINPLGLPKLCHPKGVYAAEPNSQPNTSQQSSLSIHPPHKELKHKSGESNLTDPKAAHLSSKPKSLKVPATKESVRKSILQDSSARPPVSIPSSTYMNSSLNTSPFKAQRNVMSQPDWSLRKKELAGLENPLEPPAAHSQRPSTSSGFELLNFVDIFETPVEIIDLTTKSPEKIRNPLEVDSPEKAPNRPLTRNTPEITFVNLDTVLGRSPSSQPQPCTSYPMPPKKKHKTQPNNQ